MIHFSLKKEEDFIKNKKKYDNFANDTSENFLTNIFG